MKPEELLNYMGIEASDLDTFKAQFDAQFLKRERAKSDPEISKTIAGEVTKSIAKLVKKSAKDFDIELQGEDAEKPVGDMVQLILAKQSEVFNNKFTELEKKVTAPSEALKDLESKLAKAQERADAEARAKAELAQKFEAKDKEVSEFKRGFKLNTVKDNIFKSLPFSDTANDIMRKGFNALVSEKYIIDLDDKDEPYIADAATKNRIPDPSKHGSFLTPEAVLKAELEAQKLAKVVDPNRRTEPARQEPTRQTQPMGPSGVRKVAPAALQAAEK